MPFFQPKVFKENRNFDEFIAEAKQDYPNLRVAPILQSQYRYLGRDACHAITSSYIGAMIQKYKEGNDKPLKRHQFLFARALVAGNIAKRVKHIQDKLSDFSIEAVKE